MAKMCAYSVPNLGDAVGTRLKAQTLARPRSQFDAPSERGDFRRKRVVGRIPQQLGSGARTVGLATRSVGALL
jgi:hypothetical protein